MNAVIITIGDELLTGHTVDTNSAWLCRRLNDIGIDVLEKITVADREEAINEALQRASQRARIVLTTGGLGPTKDDMTSQALSHFLDDDLVFNLGMYNRILAYFDKIKHQPTEAHRQQCYLPSSADLLLNPRGTAPGMWMRKNNVYILSLPGVPYEMQAIMEEEGLKRIEQILKHNQHIEHFIIQTAGMGETQIAKEIENIVNSFPSHLSIAYLPGMSNVKLRLTGKGRDAATISKDVVIYGQQIVKKLGRLVYAMKECSLPMAIGDLCREKKLTIGTAESCTGGHIAHLITSIAGSSDYYSGTVVSYSNNLKMKLLGVNEGTLIRYGAVSEATVKEMVIGALDTLEIDVAVAASGIAGPGGGTPEKPVGTVWIAVGNKKKTVTRKLHLAKDRDLNIKYSSMMGLNLLRLFLEDLEGHAS